MSAHSSDIGPLVHTQRSDSTITVLHVDDEPSFGKLCSEFLEGDESRLSVDTVTSAAAALEYIQTDKPDCIVSDYEMPRMDGLELLERVRESYPDLPFILFTGKGSEEIASEAISAGVTDYLQKSPGREQYRILKNRIANSVTTYRSRRSLHIFRSAAEHSGHSIYITDADGIIEYVNPSFTEITGYSADEAIGKTPAILKSGEHDTSFYTELWECILEGEVWKSEILNKRKNGELYVANQTIAPVFIRDGEPEKFVAVNQDITDLKRYQHTLEKQCENLGILNEMLRYRIRDDLQTVTGYAELLEEHVDESGKEYLDVLIERSWNGVERIEAAQNVGELLYQTEPESTLIELRDIIEEVTREVKELNDHVRFTIEQESSPIPIVAGTVVKSIVRTLIEALLCQDTGEQNITVSVSQQGRSVSIEVVDTSRDVEPDGFHEEDVLNLEATGPAASDLYLLQGFVDGYGGSIYLKDAGETTVGFAVEFPLYRSLDGEAVGIGVKAE